MENAIDYFVDSINEGKAVSVMGQTELAVTPIVRTERGAFVIELGARAAYDLIFGYDGPTKVNS